MIGCCFKLTLQMLSMPFCVKPFFRNFKQLGGGGGSCPNFLPLFILFMAFKFFCTSIINFPQGFVSYFSSMATQHGDPLMEPLFALPHFQALCYFSRVFFVSFPLFSR